MNLIEGCISVISEQTALFLTDDVLKFKYHRAVVQYCGELARRLVDYYVLPMRVEDYSAALQGYTNDLLDKYGEIMREEGLGGRIGKLTSLQTSLNVHCNS